MSIPYHLPSTCLGLDFTLYDNGANPTMFGCARLLRRELGFIHYEKQNFVFRKKPRQVVVELPLTYLEDSNRTALPMLSPKTLGQRPNGHRRPKHEKKKKLGRAFFSDHDGESSSTAKSKDDLDKEGRLVCTHLVFLCNLLGSVHNRQVRLVESIAIAGQVLEMCPDYGKQTTRMGCSAKQLLVGLSRKSLRCFDQELPARPQKYFSRSLSLPLYSLFAYLHVTFEYLHSCTPSF